MTLSSYSDNKQPREPSRRDPTESKRGKHGNSGPGARDAGLHADAVSSAGHSSAETDRASKESQFTPSDWTRTLAAYRRPIPSRSVFELAITLVPFVALWVVAWWALSISPALAIVLALANAAFLVRLFMFQHDCGHGSLFHNRRLCDWIGRAIGVLTLTPYDVWRKTHAIHHATTGNLDHRGVGDMPILTVREYQDKNRLGRAGYRLIRNPVFLFGVVPFYTFFLQNRLPVHLMKSGWRYWLSAMGTNVAIGLSLMAITLLGGWEVLLFVFLPTMLLAAITGMWFFYVQHQFEDTSWQHQGDWNIQEAALHGSSRRIPILEALPLPHRS